jgi:predicted amino acid dehydrogenase
MLLGSDRAGSADRLRELALRLPRAEATTARACVGRADVALIAVNAVDVPFLAGTFAPGAVVCDVSVPSGVRGTADGRTLLRGGVARLPGGEELGIVGFPLPVGQTFGCMAEALLLGLEGVAGRDFIGSMKIEQVFYLAELATRHGFALAGPHTFPLSGALERDRDESS